MALSGIKNNKCFSPIVKYSTTRAVTVPAGADFDIVAIIENSAILATDTAIVTIQAASAGGGTFTTGSLTEYHEIRNGVVSVYFSSTGTVAQTVTINVLVM